MNLNGVRVTEAFIDDIVANKDKYCWIPLCVDKRTLKGGQFNSLGHRMDTTGTHFATEQIGSFVNFWKVIKDGISILYGEARVPKRDELVCSMLQQLYNAENLNVSFEIVSDCLQMDGDVVVIDAGPQNALIGMAVVSAPAYPDASSAVLMVAEQETENKQERTDTDMTDEEGEMMDNEQKKDETQAVEKPDEQEEKKTPETTESAEDKPAEPDAPEDAETPKDAEDNPAEDKPAEDKPSQDAECDPHKADFDLDDCPEDVAELMEMVARLQQQVNELLPYREMVEASEKDGKMAKLRAFAEKNGMNPDDEKIAAAIEALDAEALIEASMTDAPAEEESEEAHTQAASFDSMKLDNPRAFLYERGTWQSGV